MSYLEQYHKRNELIEEADELMSSYSIIADKLYDKVRSKCPCPVTVDIEYDEDGIHYHYYEDDYSRCYGQEHFFVSIEKLEKLYNKFIRKEKLLKLEENI